MSTISDNIREYRLARGLSQADLARLLNRSVSSIQNWENGRKKLDVETFEQLCKVLKVTPNQMYGWNQDIIFDQYETLLEENAVDRERMRRSIDRLGLYLNELSKIYNEIK